MKKASLWIILSVFLIVCGCSPSITESNRDPSGASSANTSLHSNEAAESDPAADTAHSAEETTSSAGKTDAKTTASTAKSITAATTTTKAPTTPSAPAGYSPEIYMGSTYSNWAGIIETSNYSQWSYVRQNAQGWLHHINRIGHPSPGIRYSDADFAKIMNIMKENNLKLMVEAKSYYVEEHLGTDYANIGYHDAQHHLGYIKRVYDAGYKVHSINLDGAYFDYMNQAGLSRADVRRNLVTYFETIHKAYPDIELYFLFNLPNWGWKGQPAYRTDQPGNNMYMGDAHEVYNFIMPAIQKAVPMAGIAVDNPYDYAAGTRVPANAERTNADLKATDWVGRILELEQMAHKDSMKFSLIFNCQTGGETSGALYTANTVKMIELYMGRGGRPDNAVMESWYPHHPAEWLPETNSGTMAGCVKAAIDAIAKYK